MRGTNVKKMKKTLIHLKVEPRSVQPAASRFPPPPPSLPHRCGVGCLTRSDEILYFDVERKL